MKISLNRLTGPIAASVLLTAVALGISSGAHADADLLKEGETVFKTIAGIGCAGCHGDYAEGDLGVGPYIRGASEGTIRAAIDGIGPMIVIKNTISDEQIAAVSAYVNSLGGAQVARTLVKRGRFLPESFSTRPGTTLQFVVKNGSFKDAHSYVGDAIDMEPLTVGPRDTGSFLWRAPDEEGTYTLSCSDCKLKDQVFTVRVDSSAAKFFSTAPALSAIDSDSM